MKKLLIIAATMLSAFAISAQAAPGAYLQAQVGKGGIYTKKYSANDDPYKEVDLRGTAYRLSGGYLITDKQLSYGVELGYASYANNKYRARSALDYTEKYSGFNVDLLGVAKFDLAKNFYIVGKVGAAYVKQDYKLTEKTAGTSFSKTKSKLAPKIAAGIGYDFTQQLGMNLTVDHIFAGKADPDGDSLNDLTKVSSVTTAMIGLTYTL